MEENFKLKMQELARANKQRQDDQIDPKELQKEKKEKEDIAKKHFNKIKQESLIPTGKELNEIFKETGNSFLIFSNEDATALKDQIRTFCQLFYFPKDRGQSMVGLNSASLLFECFPLREEVQIAINTELRPSPLVLIQTINLFELKEKTLEDTISNFVSEVTKS
jgi:hypothetical protein